MNQRSRSSEIKRLIEESRALRERSRTMIDECRKQLTEAEDPLSTMPSAAELSVASNEEQHQAS